MALTLDFQNFSSLLIQIKLIESDNQNTPGIERYFEHFLLTLWLVTSFDLRGLDSNLTSFLSLLSRTDGIGIWRRTYLPDQIRSSSRSPH